MKYSLIAFFTSFFALTTARAQDHTVVIPDSVAVYFLEQNQRAKILTSEIVVLKQEINVLKEQLTTKDSIKSTLVLDSTDYKGLLQVKTDRLKFLQDQLDLANKQIKRLKFKLVLTYVGAVVVFIITLFVWQNLRAH